MNGTLYDRDRLPPELAIRFGISLGLSPACYLRDDLLLAQHLDVLARAAETLGYTGFDPAAAEDAISATDLAVSVVALVPTPADHKAAAPGTDWTLVVEPFTAPDPSSALRLHISQHRRNHRSPTINVLLVGDAELHAGTREAVAAGCDEVVWLNVEGAVSCIGAGALLADVGGPVVTPPRSAGVPDSAWRTACVELGGAVEQSVGLGDLREARSLACLWPWGAVQTVAGIGGTTYADSSLAARVGAALGTVTGRS